MQSSSLASTLAHPLRARKRGAGPWLQGLRLASIHARTHVVVGLYHRVAHIDGVNAGDIIIGGNTRGGWPLGPSAMELHTLRPN